MRASGDVGEGLVYRDALDVRGEITQDFDRGVAEPLVFGEVSGDENELRTELPRAASGHAAPDAEGPRFVRRRQHDSTTDRNRPAPEARVEQLLDRGIKRVEI